MSESTKHSVARLLRLPIFTQLLGLGVRLMVPRQRVGVALVGFNDEMEILMLRHVFHPTFPWGLPGGWLGRNEDPRRCALRELREETGLRADLGPVVYVAHERLPAHVGIAYAGRIQGSDPILSGEILEAAWFRLDSLPQPLLPFTQQAIEEAAARYAVGQRVEG